MHNALPSRPVTRRDVTRAAAWSLPVVAVAAAAPAASASPVVITLLITGPTAATADGSTMYSYAVKAVDQHGQPADYPDGTRLVPPQAFSPRALWGGGWSWSDYQLTLYAGRDGGLSGVFQGGPGQRVFNAYLPGASTPSATKTVTVS